MRQPAHYPASRLRRCLELVVLLICVLLILRTWGVEAYQVPTGSMAPTLLGNHRHRTCPRCGWYVVVGRDGRDTSDPPLCQDCYRTAYCPNCGFAQLNLRSAPAAHGDHILVNKSYFAVRRPRRWELVVFRFLGIIYIKRILGLPGEEIEIRDGDLYVNGELARKDLDQLRHLRVPIFDLDFRPEPLGWQPRFEVAPPVAVPPLAGGALRLDGSAGLQVVTYCQRDLDTLKSEAIGSEYAYNGGERRAIEPVHDFMLECRLEVQQGQGAVLLGITDGQDRLRVELPVGTGGAVRIHRVASWAAPLPQVALAERSGVSLQPGKTYKVELAFVDRRVSLALDGTALLPPVDLAPPGKRAAMDRPVMLGARGVKATVRQLRLFRDLHYTQAGKDGVGGRRVRLGSGEYFVLGDNSSASRDSRFWADDGPIPEPFRARELLGKPFLVHLPGRRVAGSPPVPEGSRKPDWARVRWLH